MRDLPNLVLRLLQDRKGATLVEYGFILALIVLAFFVAVAGVGIATSGMWNNVSGEMRRATG